MAAVIMVSLQPFLRKSGHKAHRQNSVNTFEFVFLFSNSCAIL